MLLGRAMACWERINLYRGWAPGPLTSILSCWGQSTVILGQSIVFQIDGSLDV